MRKISSQEIIEIHRKRFPDDRFFSSRNMCFWYTTVYDGYKIKSGVIYFVTSDRTFDRKIAWTIRKLDEKGVSDASEFQVYTEETTALSDCYKMASNLDE